MSDVTPSDPNKPPAPPPPGPAGQAPPAPPPYPGPPPNAPPPGRAPAYGQPPSYGPPPTGASYGYVPGPVDSQGRPLAEWWQRLVAILIDGFIIGVVYRILIGIVVGSSFGSSSYTGFGFKLWIVTLIAGLGGLAYFALMEGSPRGQSLGQMALGIAVRDAQSGGPITTQRAGIRMVILYPWLVLIWIPFVGPVLALIADVWSLVCGLSPLWNDRRQGYHDVSQKTLVVKVR